MISNLHGRRAISVIPGDGVPVPSPSYLKVDSTNTSAVAGSLVDTAGDFINKGVKHGDIVYNITDGSSAVVLQRDSATTVILSANIFAAGSKAYKIYSGEQLDEPTLYVGGTGNLTVVTAGGDTVTFVSIPAATFVPILVTEVSSTGTTCTDIVAMW